MLLCSVQYMAITLSATAVHPPVGLEGGSGLKNCSRTQKFRKGHEEHHKWNCRERVTQAESESTKTLSQDM